MEIIEVIPRMTEPTFKTLKAAIVHAERINRERRNDEVTPCIGQVIRSADWHKDGIFIGLEGGRTLCFRLNEEIVDLTVENDVGYDLPSESQTDEAILVFSDGREVPWRRSEVIAALPGNSLHRVYAGQAGFWLYAANCEILWIWPLFERRTELPFLYWGWTD